MSHGVGYASIQEVTKRRRENCLQLHRLICDVELICSQKTLDEELNKQYWLAAQKWEGKVFKKCGESLNSHYENAVKKKLALLSQKYMEEKRKRSTIQQQQQGFDNSSSGHTQLPQQTHPTSRYTQHQHPHGNLQDYHTSSSSYANPQHRVPPHNRESTPYSSNPHPIPMSSRGAPSHQQPHHASNSGYSAYAPVQPTQSQPQQQHGEYVSSPPEHLHRQQGVYPNENNMRNQPYPKQQNGMPGAQHLNGGYSRSGMYDEAHAAGYGNAGMGGGYDELPSVGGMRPSQSPPRSSSVPVSSNVHPSRQSPHRNMDSHVRQYSSPMANARNMDVSPVPGAYGYQNPAQRNGNQYERYEYRRQGGNNPQQQQAQYGSPAGNVYRSPVVQGQFQQMERPGYGNRYGSSGQQAGGYGVGGQDKMEHVGGTSQGQGRQGVSGADGQAQDRYKVKYEEVLAKMRGSTIQRIRSAKSFYVAQGKALRKSSQAESMQTQKSIHTISQLVQYLTDCENFLLHRGDPKPGNYHHALFKLRKIYHNVITIEGKVKQQQQQRAMHSSSSSGGNQMYHSSSGQANQGRYNQSNRSSYAPHPPQTMSAAHQLKKEESPQNLPKRYAAPVVTKSTTSQTVQSSAGSSYQPAQPAASRSAMNLVRKEQRVPEVKPEVQNNTQRKPNRKRNLDEAMATTVTQPERNVRPRNDAKSGKNFSALQRSKETPEQQVVNLVDDEEPAAEQKPDVNEKSSSPQQVKPKVESKIEKQSNEAKQSEDSDLELFTDEFFGSSPLLDYLAKNKDGAVNLDIKGFAEQADQVLSEFCSKF